MPVLVEMDGSRVFEVGDGATLGRDPACTIQLEGPLVSRLHARIKRTFLGRYQIEDLGSKHGTWKDGQRVARTGLSNNDEVVLGSTRLRFQTRLVDEVVCQEVPPDQACLRFRSDWETGQAFLADYDGTDGWESFWHPVPADQPVPDVDPGALVEVVIAFADVDCDFLLHTRVIDRVTVGDKRGLRLGFAAAEASRRELVLACARGESVAYFRRRHERFACHLPVGLTPEGGRRQDAVATVISEGGLGLAAVEGLLPDDRIKLSVQFPSGARFKLKGRVASLVTDGPERRVGVEFLFDSAEQQASLIEQVKGLRDSLPPEE